MKTAKRLQVTICVVMSAIILLFGSVNTTEVRAQSFYSWGSYGDTIRTIQTKLSRWGYYTGPVDGIFGYKTYEALLYFQKTNGLKQDGIAGKTTLEAMGIFQASKISTSPSPTVKPTVKPTASPSIAPSLSPTLTPATPTPQTEPPSETTEVIPVDGQSAREADIWLLAKIINGEGRGESYIGQIAIGAVVMNRVKHAGFPNTISGVIYQAGAFDAIKDGQFDLAPLETCVNAARDAYNGWDPVDGAVFYWNPTTATSKWILTLTVTKTIGNHVFAIN